MPKLGGSTLHVILPYICESSMTASLDRGLKRNTAPRDQILPVSINWPTNYNFASFSKLPTNYTNISEKIQKKPM